MTAKNVMRTERGFGLIEIAVVLFISGILLTVITVGINSLAVGAREKTTRTKLLKHIAIAFFSGRPVR